MLCGFHYRKWGLARVVIHKKVKVGHAISQKQKRPQGEVEGLHRQPQVQSKDVSRSVEQAGHQASWHLSSAIRQGNKDEVMGNRKSGVAFSEGLAP